MDAVTNVPFPAERADPGVCPRQPRAGRAAGPDPGAGRRAGRADHDHRRPAADGRRRPDRRRPAAQPPARAGPARARPPTTTWPPPSRPPARPRRRGGTCPSTTGPRSSSRPPTCWPARGGRPSTRPPCSASPSRRYQAEIDAACELIDFWRFNVHFARRLLAEQPGSSPGSWNRTGLPAARGLRARDHAVQLHLDRRQPADRARADGQHGGLEAVAHPAAVGALPDAAAGGRGPAARRDQHGDRRAARRCPASRCRTRDLAGIHFTGSTGTFQHLWRTVGENIAALPRLPAAGRRDRRQGLRHRPPVGRPGRAGHRAGPRRVRVPGPEVLGRLARLRPAQRLEPDPRRPARRHRVADRRRRQHRPVDLHGRGHRRPGLRHGTRDAHRPGQDPARRQRAGRRRHRRQRRATSSSPPCW